MRARLARPWFGIRSSRPPARPPRASRVGLPAAVVAGAGPGGEAVEVAGLGPGGGPVVALLFLTSSCQGCREIWDGLAQQGPLRGAGLTAVVTPGPELEDRNKVAALAAGTVVAPNTVLANTALAAGTALANTVPVVMSARAWADYDVTRSPFAVVVRGGRIAGEGPLSGWDDARGLLERWSRPE